MAKPTPGPDFEALTDILRQLFATLSAPPPKPSTKALKGQGAVTPKAEAPEDDEEEDEDEMPDLPMGMPMGKGLMGGKPMRRLTISILMPAKGLPPLKLKK